MIFHRFASQGLRQKVFWEARTISQEVEVRWQVKRHSTYAVWIGKTAGDEKSGAYELIKQP